MQFQCPDGDYSLVTLDGADVPACASGDGVWVTDPVPFWEQTLDQTQMNDLLTAVLAFCALVWICKRVGAFIEEHWSSGV